MFYEKHNSVKLAVTYLYNLSQTLCLHRNCTRLKLEAVSTVTNCESIVASLDFTRLLF